jgi:hypothetical protein
MAPTLFVVISCSWDLGILVHPGIPMVLRGSHVFLKGFGVFAIRNQNKKISTRIQKTN